ncbi:MAG: SIMPL domain-containing protein [Pirellulaceae bacterium]|nr:SIMPL domain-containing protein [Pirellulaceae bacterium]
MPLLLRTTLLFVLVAQASIVAANEPELPTVSVTGTAEVRVLPDQAILRFSIDSRALALAAAVGDNDTKVTAVTQYLTQNKIEARFIRTDVIRIQPLFETPNKSRQQSSNGAGANTSAEQKIQPIGYSARRDISVTIKNLSQFEAIYRGLIERGVNEVNNVSFLSSELRKHREEARLMAVRAAKQKANVMASELGCKLAAVQSIRESGPSYRGSNMMTNRFADVPGGSEGAVASGMITISASVDIVFLLGDVELGK